MESRGRKRPYHALGITSSTSLSSSSSSPSLSWTKYLSSRRISTYSIAWSSLLWFWFWIRHQQRTNDDVIGSQNAPPSANIDHPLLQLQPGVVPKKVNGRKLNMEPKTLLLPAVVTTAYLEPIDTDWLEQTPLPSRNTSASKLTAVIFPRVSCWQDRVENFPVDEYPREDPFLPWIHDYFPTQHGEYIQFVAQNRRKCSTGKEHEDTMKFWEPQVSLFQAVPVTKVEWNTTMDLLDANHQPTYQLGTSPDNATFPETRFICHFHNHLGQEATTHSEYSFNYEHITWRKGQSTTIATKGRDSAQYWLSQLLFRCPVPAIFQDDIRHGHHGSIHTMGGDANDISHRWTSQLWLDVVPIRTPARKREFLFTERHVGAQHLKGIKVFDTKKAWTSNHVLPAVTDSGRWTNLPICQVPYPRGARNNKPPLQDGLHSTRQNTSTLFRLVACTWTAAAYTRPGQVVSVDDSARRLREWIVFHSMVGFEHFLIYDNTQHQPSPLRSIAEEFPDRVTYYPWPCQICNNNLPTDPDPREWSSQHAAESSCRERYGPLTEWMAFLDIDEYMVPIRPNRTNKINLNKGLPHWHDVLDTIDTDKARILKMKSSRGKPRHHLMELMEDQSSCQIVSGIFENETLLPCIAPRKNATFLQVYNCDPVKRPRPEYLARAMKQIYRPDYVLSHYVHYSTVTKDLATYFADHPASKPDSNVSYIRSFRRKTWLGREVFLDELNQGMLIHARSVLPHETTYRNHTCYLNATFECMIGFPCPQSVHFVDGLSEKNGLSDQAGDFCNCWPDETLETVLIPGLETLLLQKAA